MNLRLILLGALISCAAFGCSSTGPQPLPSGAPQSSGTGGPHVDQTTPITGNAVFNGSY